jgi:hypothetical protein
MSETAQGITSHPAAFVSSIKMVILQAYVVVIRRAATLAASPIAAFRSC